MRRTASITTIYMGRTLLVGLSRPLGRHAHEPLEGDRRGEEDRLGEEGGLTGS
jgi:hypothetical protein